MKILVAFDPGETTGIAIAHLYDDGTFYSWVKLDQIPHKDMPEWFAQHPVEEGVDVVDVVYERFITYKQYAQRQIGSKQVAAQVIGMIKMWAHQHKAAIHEQGADILQVAGKWSGISTPKQHSKSHRFDAANHGYYFLVKAGRAKTALEKELEHER